MQSPLTSDLTAVKKNSVTDEIVSQLVSFIVAKGFKTGDKLPSEKDLRERFGVGRSSMREALKVLATVGAVEVVSGQGMFVGQGGISVMTSPLFWALMMGEQDRQEVVDARRLLEMELAAMAAEHSTEAEVLAIAKRLEAMKGNLADLENYSRQDLEFHLAIAAAAHNRVLAQMLEALRHIIRVWIYETFSTEALVEHVPIYEAIRGRDPAAARQAMAAHMTAARTRLVSHLSSSRTPSVPDITSEAQLSAQPGRPLP